MLLCRRSFFAKGLERARNPRQWQQRSFNIYTRLFDDLEARGFIHDSTGLEKLREAFSHGRRMVYAGIDPTANALHVGHLIPLMCLLHFQIRGHQIIPLIGGATGLIGDPSGRSSERNRIDPTEVEINVQALTTSVERFYKNAFTYAEKRLGPNVKTYYPANVSSNLQWFKDMSLLSFLQDIGFHARLNTMLNRESVQARLTSPQGISFTEFAYQLLQGYDFYHLHKHYNCIVQIGGSDQWGNILAGIDLIHKANPYEPVNLRQKAKDKYEAYIKQKAFGITTPLLTAANGEKFGKSAGNAVWLDHQKTRPVDFYQFWLRTLDTDVEKYLKLFTLLGPAEIERTLKLHQANPEKRIAQRLLAGEVTTLVHGEVGLTKALALTDVFYGTGLKTLVTEDIVQAMQGDPRLVMITRQELMNTPVPQLLATYGLVGSTSQARELCWAGGLYVNDQAFRDPHDRIRKQQLIDSRIAVFRAGKTRFLIFVVQN
ncbi:hypothetical protein HGRIS_002703 [Hohenbuehelia grisea]|uniref:Tyrosine--tRNA ligase n=1 Tax=Hohenbuehelia grisea TaxID=104357 RepID=A0ABR3JLF8_9AGAR